MKCTKSMERGVGKSANSGCKKAVGGVPVSHCDGNACRA